MAKLEFKTRGNSSPENKPRVFFTSHPSDLSRSLDKISSDIFLSHDCAIYYTPDMTESFDAEERESVLQRMNLFVIPITFELLSTPSRAMDEDFPFARKMGIPVLPIMMEGGIDHVYSLPEKFGAL